MGKQKYLSSCVVYQKQKQAICHMEWMLAALTALFFNRINLVSP